MTFQRTTMNYANEESLDIYAGTSATGTPIYSEVNSQMINNKVYDPTDHCLAHGSYYVQMGDSYSSRKMAHKARKFFRTFFCHFYSWPPFFYLASFFIPGHLRDHGA